MGQHTWFRKDATVYRRLEEIYKALDDIETGAKYEDELTVMLLENEADGLYKSNETVYYDCFRTNKRNAEGCYIEDVIYSKKECYEWLKKNKEFVYYLDKDSLNQFWEKFPNGVIDFG